MYLEALLEDDEAGPADIALICLRDTYCGLDVVVAPASGSTLLPRLLSIIPACMW